MGGRGRGANAGPRLAALGASTTARPPWWTIVLYVRTALEHMDRPPLDEDGAMAVAPPRWGKQLYAMFPAIGGER